MASSEEKQISTRLADFGTTIFTEISALAAKHGAVNLGQGFPNFDGPQFIKDAAVAALAGPHNQYARMAGVPELCSAIADRVHKDLGLKVDPEAEVTVTVGCTEAIAAAMLGLVNPGDEVLLFEPFYDSYKACLRMAGATLRTVTLRAPDFRMDEEELRAAFSDRTRLVLINTPHNPTGKMFSRVELELLAELCVKHDAIVLSDEVYYKLTYGANEHVSIATLPGMYSRTVLLGSLGKTFSLTGWKIGWAVAPPNITWGIRQAHSFLTFAVATPLQLGAVAALTAPDEYFEQLKKDYTRRKDILVGGLREVGFDVFEPQGSFFVMVDHTKFGYGSDVEFCRHLITHVGVAAIPPSGFYEASPEEGARLVRFAFCKDDATLHEGVRRLKERLRPRGQESGTGDLST